VKVFAFLRRPGVVFLGGTVIALAMVVSAIILVAVSPLSIGPVIVLCSGAVIALQAVAIHSAATAIREVRAARVSPQRLAELTREIALLRDRQELIESGIRDQLRNDIRTRKTMMELADRYEQERGTP
jgi:hypothetical protein